MPAERPQAPQAHYQAAKPHTSNDGAEHGHDARAPGTEREIYRHLVRGLPRRYVVAGGVKLDRVTECGVDIEVAATDSEAGAPNGLARLIEVLRDVNEQRGGVRILTWSDTPHTSRCAVTWCAQKVRPSATIDGWTDTRTLGLVANARECSRVARLSGHV